MRGDRPENLELFERDGVLENVREQSPTSQRRLEELRELPIVGDVRGAGFFWAVELVADGGHALRRRPARGAAARLHAGRLLRGGLIARADDRGDSVVQIAPPLIGDRAELDELVGRVADVLADSGEFLAKLGTGIAGMSATLLQGGASWPPTASTTPTC